MPGLSNWREEFNLSEVVTGKMTDKEALKKVSEKSGINNKVTINPKLDEAVKEIGGEVIGMVEQDTTAQKQRIDMKQMILDRQKLKIRRKDLSAAKKEQQNDVEGDSTNATKQSNIIAQEAVQGQDTATRKAMAGERKAGDKRVAPGKAKQNAERVMQSVRFYDKITKGKNIAGVAEETEVKEGVMKMVKRVISKKKPEKKAEKAMDAGARAKRLLARKIHAKYVSGSEDNVPDDIAEASAVLDANKKLEKEKKTKKDKAELAKLTHIYKGMKKGIYNSYEPEGESIDERTLSSYIPSDRQGEARRANLDYVKAQLKKKEDESTKNRGDLSKRDAGKMAKERLRTKKISSLGEAEDKAFNFVRNKLKAKYGDGVLTTGEKVKPPTAAQKKAAAAHREKIAKQQAAEFKKDPSQGRYPKGYSNRGSD